MKLEKAIEIINEHLRFYRFSEDEYFKDALQLGTEAMKRLKELRTPSSGNPHLQLPGETEE